MLTRVPQLETAGTINVDVAMNGCPKLSVDSLLSLLNALCENPQDLTCQIGTTNLCKLTDQQKTLPPIKGGSWCDSGQIDIKYGTFE